MLTPIVSHSLFPVLQQHQVTAQELIPTHTCVAAIAVNPTTKDDALTPNPNPIGIAVIRLSGAYYEKLECAVIEDRPFEPTRIIDRLLQLSLLFSFNRIFLDKDNYILFAADNLFNKRCQLFINNNPKLRLTGQQNGLPDAPLPSLSPVQRSSDIILRQQLSLTQPINDGLLKFSKNISESDKEAILNKGNYGSFAKTDALAIAVTEALKIKDVIYQNIDDDQRRLMQSKGKSIY